MLAVLAVSCALHVARPCPFHGADHHHHDEEETAPFSVDAHAHHDHRHLLRHHDHANEQEDDEDTAVDIHMRSLYPKPHHHKKLPAKFDLCGMPEPTIDERLQLGIAHYDYDQVQARNTFQGVSQRQPITVPVWFHVFKKSKTEGRLTVKQLKEGFMAALQAGYAGTGITFQYAGRTQRVNPTW